MTNQRKLLRINLAVIASYFVVKFLLRPYILDNNFLEVLQIFVLSYPNFCEAVAGSIVITFMTLWLNNKLLQEASKIKAHIIYIFSVSVAGLYVILQEFKVHNLGGNNVYDPYDVVFSLVGLITAYALLIFIKPRIVD